MIQGLEDMTCEVRLKDLNLFNRAKRKPRRLLGTENDLKDNYKDDGAKFFLVIADVIRRDNDHKLQAGRFHSVTKLENQLLTQLSQTPRLVFLAQSSLPGPLANYIMKMNRYGNISREERLRGLGVFSLERRRFRGILSMLVNNS
ncbi:hypothetical protein QYF61_022316 [Mycteria americana]|uniref:Uncharacterized protein n=1 Tax=Mycteria americana TaxID=33587 RepID=A0AAN7NHY4_MYCAM|nr:hypothetical protein QYF61_022316 [Mycteria americana]